MKIIGTAEDRGFIPGMYTKSNDGNWLRVAPRPSMFTAKPDPDSLRLDDRPALIIDERGDLMMGYYAGPESKDPFPALSVKEVVPRESREMFLNVNVVLDRCLEIANDKDIPGGGFEYRLSTTDRGSADLQLYIPMGADDYLPAKDGPDDGQSRRCSLPEPQIPDGPPPSHTLTVEIKGCLPLHVRADGFETATTAAAMFADVRPEHAAAVLFDATDVAPDVESIELSYTTNGQRIGARWEQPFYSGFENPTVHGTVGLGLGAHVRGLDPERGLDRIAQAPASEMQELCIFAGYNLHLNTDQILQAFAQVHGTGQGQELTPLSELLENNEVFADMPSTCYIRVLSLNEDGHLRRRVEPAYDIRDTLKSGRNQKSVEALMVMLGQTGDKNANLTDVCRGVVAGIAEDADNPLAPRTPFEVEAAAMILQMQYGLPYDRKPLMETGRQMEAWLPDNPGEKRDAIESMVRRVIGGAREAGSRLTYNLKQTRAKQQAKAAPKQEKSPKQKKKPRKQADPVR